MKFKVLICAFILLLFSVSGASAWTNTGGGDHGGANWTVADATTISGNHTNINIFTIASGDTATIQTATILRVYAIDVIIDGTLNGNGKGFNGGAGGAAEGGHGGTGAGTGGATGGDGHTGAVNAAAGGGGGYGDTGLNGANGGVGGIDGGVGGTEYGTLSGAIVEMGSGAGGGGGGYLPANPGGVGGAGGAGIGLFTTYDINISGTITTNGANGVAGGGYGAGGGGGSGGSILLSSENEIYISGTLSSTSGTGVDGGGSGAGGRIKIFANAGNISSATITVTGGASGTSYSYIQNAPPSTPSIISPINETMVSQIISMSVNSTDADNDTLIYYIYGDTVDGTTLLNISSDGTYNWNISGYDTFYWKAKAYDGYEYGNLTSLQQFITVAPPTPTLNSPLHQSIVYAGNVVLNVTSSISGNDSITYYFYGGTDPSSLSFLGTNDTTDGSYYTWDISIRDEYYWTAFAGDGYSNSSNMTTVYFTLLTTPDLYTPINASVHTYSYPPLMHDLMFTWENTGAAGYKYQVATDENFNLISVENTIPTNTTTLSLKADDYYWRVYAYDELTAEFSNVSETWQFTINETNGDGAITAIDGVVYEVTAAGSVAVDGALVNIWNTTWSDSMLVGQNGYYYFDGAKDGTYSLRATKTGYTDSSIELVTVTALNTTTRNILLQSTSGAGQQYVDHYVKFTVKSLFGALYSGVDVNVYLEDAVIPQYTATTGNDGSVAFELNENQRYRLTFISASQGINEERTLYPIENAYNVYVIANIFATGGNIISDDISVTIETATAGANAYINVTYTDNKTETTALYFYLNQSNIHDSQNQTLIASSGEIHATGFYSFTVTDYTGEAYLIHVHATHDTYGDIKESYSVRFEGLLDSFGWDGIWVLIALGCITFTAFMFGAKNATQGSFVICVEAWLFIAMGMFGDYNTIWFKAGVAMATLISILANMEKHDSERS